MLEPRTCRTCGAPLPDNTGADRCVHCLPADGSPTEPSGEPASPAGAAHPAARPTVALPLPATEKPGDRIGRYRLLQPVGEGGCGVVYVAEQEEPVRRRVALKVIKLGMDTREVVARFEAERQALALMDHPHIAKVLDGGATAQGRPYFVMDLVRGIPITRYCDEHRLDTTRRLQLFVLVCRAVQHAHQKGIIHRDLKPSNILVTDQDDVPTPKVIDFGIAKATTGQTLTDKTLFTALEQFIGTPAYMSPEQAGLDALDIDTRTDIYSLGVLLYEILTGTTPFDAKRLTRGGFDEIRRIIREEDPPRPSTRLSTLDAAEGTTVARLRQSEPPKLVGLVRGDLDWIVMKCLEKDRTRRYETANGLAMDIVRHLEHQPVVARPPTTIYRFHKLVRRHKLTFAAAGAIGLALVISSVVSARMYLGEKDARRRAAAAEQVQSRLRQEAEQSRAGEATQRATAEQRLYQSLMREARATRLARRAGYRNEVFDMLRQARALNVPQKEIIDLRNEAVACFGDFVGLAPVTVAAAPPRTEFRLTRLDPTGTAAAFLLSDGTILVKQMPAGTEAGRLAGESPARHMCFSRAGDQLFSVHFGNAPNLPEALAGSHIEVWARAPDGRWSQSRKIPLAGAYSCLASAGGIFAVTLTQEPRSGALVDLATLAVTHRFPYPSQGIPELALSPDGQFLAVETLETPASTDSMLELRNLGTGAIVKRLDPHLGSLASISFSPDGRFLGLMSRLGAALYTTDDFRRVAEFRDYFESPSRVSFDSNSTLLSLPLYQQHRVRVWDRLRNEDLAVLTEPADVFEACLAPDSKFLLTCIRREARLYPLQVPAERLGLPDSSGGVPAVAFSPDGARVATVGKDQALRVWDAATGQPVWKSAELLGPGQALAYSPDSRWLATTDWNTSMVWLWDAASGKRLQTLGSTRGGRMWSVRFSPDGRLLAAAGNGPADGIRLWTLESNSAQAAAGAPTANLIQSSNMPAWNLAFSPDSRQLAFIGVAGGLRGLYVWEFAGGAPPRLLSTRLVGGGVIVQTVEFSRDGRRVLTVGPNREVVALNVETGQPETVLQTVPPDRARGWTAFANLGSNKAATKLAIASPSSLGVDIWDPKNRKLLYSLPEEGGTVWWLAWSPDDSRLAVARSNGDTVIWSIAEIERQLADLGLGL